MAKITPTLLTRIASGMMLLHAIGHTTAIVTWQNPNGKIPSDVIRKMQEAHFLFGGQDATMAKFFSGHGYAGTILLLLIVTLLWVISSWPGKKATGILWVIGISICALSVDELIYFFPMAVVFSLIAAVLVFVAIFQLNKTAIK
ncbi:MAG TPA: hypothetical protein VNS58_23995 [Puia sp.]|nr:hypothetical protein [Puia sp.]